MRHSLLAAAILATLLAGCAPGGQAPASDPNATAAATDAVSEADTAFAAIAARFLDEGLALSPVYATGMGDHRFDAELDDLSPEGRQKAVAWAEGLLADLGKIDATQLSRENQG